MSVVQLSVCPWQEPPPLWDFKVAWAILSNFHFTKKKKKNFFFSQFFFFFFQPKNFFHLQKMFLPSLFYIFLDALCHPECSKKISPQNFLQWAVGEARRDTMLPSYKHSRSSLLFCPVARLWLRLFENKNFSRRFLRGAAVPLITPRTWNIPKRNSHKLSDSTVFFACRW